jgi:hypothetical protein
MLRKVLGLLLLALPVVVVTDLMVGTFGWRFALLVWGVLLALVGCLVGGLELLIRQ